jgi:hypothetical protein
LIVLGLVLLYDVLAGKAKTIVGVLNGTVENGIGGGQKQLHAGK